MSAAAFDALAEELEGLLSQGPLHPWAEGSFEALALRCFAVQYEENPVYRALCEAREVSPDTVSSWKDVPAVPATAFKHLEILTGSAEDVEVVFRTSGTTRGGEARGRHHVRSMSLYRASALANFEAYLLPEARAFPLVSLIPSLEQAPDSSLSAMMDMVAADRASTTHWLVDGSGTLDVEGFLAMAESGEDLLVVGTAFAFVHLLDALEERNRGLTLPEGTRLMETGGFKGRVEEVSRETLYRRIRDVLGVPENRVVNEYGMTELLSQLYEPVLREGSAANRRHVPPPWLGIRALDPVTLEEMPPGEDGLLCFFDLANLGSVCHVLTEDVGSVSDDGVRLKGRSPGSEPRGCSRAMDELMRATGGAR